MGKVDLGINLAKDVAAFLKTGSGRSLLRRQPSIFHGINPTLTYPPTGKTFALPRFCTVEMKQARQMNRIASRQIKAPVNSTFSKASAEDLRRLTSETIEDSYSRVQWTNPKDGKVYNLLKQGETEDGKVLVRILDQDGAFIKEAEMMPKKIVIYDTGKTKVDLGSYYEEISHGELVTRFAKRANPFADIKFVNIDRERPQKTILDIHLNLEDELKQLQQRLINGEKVDYISLSLGLNSKIIPPKSFLEKAGKSLKEYKTSVDTFPTSQLIKAHPNLRILQASGNNGKDVISPDLMFKSVEGVGALGKDGKIAEFSSSRNSLLTQHYEQGIFTKHPTRFGLGYFDSYSTDIALKPKFAELAQNYIGKTPDVVDDNLYRQMNKLKEIARKKYKEEFNRIRKQVVTIEEENKLNKLKEIFRNESDPIKKKFANKEYWDYSRNLNNKVRNEMINYENPEGLQYKEFITYTDKNNLVHRGLRTGEYETFERTPYETDFDTLSFITDLEGKLCLAPASKIFPVQGTSFSTPIRTAKLALNDMMEGIL